MPTPPFAEDTIAYLALSTERQVTHHLSKAFNLNMLGVVEDSGATLEALQVIAHLNSAMVLLAEFQNSILNRCNGT
jgi:hypothetical protein